MPFVILFMARSEVKRSGIFRHGHGIAGLSQVRCYCEAPTRRRERGAVSVSAVQISSCWKVLCCCENHKAETVQKSSFVVIAVGLLGFGQLQESL